MKLASFIAVSVLSGTFAMGALLDTANTPAARSITAPTAPTPLRVYVPIVEQMPKSYLEATILYNQNGNAIFVDTGGQTLPLSQSFSPQETTSPLSRLQPPQPGDTKPKTSVLNHPKRTRKDRQAIQTLIKRMQWNAAQARVDRQQPILQGRSEADPTISHWLTPVSSMTSNEIH